MWQFGHVGALPKRPCDRHGCLLERCRAVLKV